jgi:putative spermidine/putrescine transport system substrate-binding protein
MRTSTMKKLVAIIASGGLMLIAMAPTPASAANTIRLYIGADTNVKDLWEKALLPEFYKVYPDYNVEITYDRNGQNDAQTLAKVVASKATRKDPGMDIIDGGMTVQLGGAGMLWRGTSGLLPNLKNVPQVLIKNGKGGIPYRASLVLLAYNSKNVKTPPKTLAELLAYAKANPGKFTYNAPSGGGSGYSFVQTVIDSNLTKKEIEALVTLPNKPLQEKWEKGFETLRALNKVTYGQNGTYPVNNAATLDLLAKGLVDIGPVWSDQIASALKSGTMPKDIKTTTISNPSFTGGPAFLGIPNNSPNRNAARVLVNWVLSPAAQNIIVTGVMNGLPVIPVELLDPAAAALIGQVDITTLRPGYLNSNAVDLRAAWASKVPGK